MIEQIAIALTGVVAIRLSQDKRTEVRKYSSIFGLVGQPFWFYSSFVAEQWGIFALCFLYTYSWAHGFYNSWVNK